MYFKLRYQQLILMDYYYLTQINSRRENENFIQYNRQFINNAKNYEF